MLIICKEAKAVDIVQEIDNLRHKVFTTLQKQGNIVRYFMERIYFAYCRYKNMLIK